MHLETPPGTTDEPPVRRFRDRITSIQISREIHILMHRTFRFLHWSQDLQVLDRAAALSSISMACYVCSEAELGATSSAARDVKLGCIRLECFKFCISHPECPKSLINLAFITALNSSIPKRDHSLFSQGSSPSY